MDAAGSVRARAGALAAADGLVVREPVTAEGEVVHRPLALGGHGYQLTQRGEDDVDDAGRGLGVPGDDGGGWTRVDEAALGRRHDDRGECAARRRQVRLGETTDDAEGGRLRHGGGGGGGGVATAGPTLRN